MTIIMVIMARQQHYALIYAPEVKRHLQAIDAKHYHLIREKIEEQLQFEPGVETTNRKPLRQPAALAATWEIRFGPGNRFRVFYDIDVERREVQVLAIGEKERNRLFIGGEEVEL
jgi:mRNA-degrading endonuclease RelE of RelBE toxin-antitoxin system